MELSLFFAKFLGLYCLIVGFLCLFRHRQFKKTSKELLSSSSGLAISAEISLLLGLAIVIEHSIWEWSWRGLITVLGYLMLFKAVFRFAFPEKARRGISKVLGKGYWAMTIILLIIGAYLTYCGFHYS